MSYIIMGAEHRTPSSFPTEDPRLKHIQQQLTPEKRTAIRALFQKEGLKAKKDEIVAVRCDDVVTVIQYLVDGKISAGARDEVSIRGKEKNWFYATPIYAHSAFGDISQQEENRFRSFAEIVRDENTEIYGRSTAFATAFATNIIPLLPNDWISHARKLLSVTLEGKEASPEDYSNEQVAEDYIDRIFDELRTQAGENTFLNLSPSGVNKSFALSDLIQLINHQDPTVTKDAIKFLQTACREREGVVVGFSKELLEQGQVLSDVGFISGFQEGDEQSNEVIHSSPEIAVRPTSGSIPTSTIVAIESLGEYEDAILRQLGILS